MAKATFYKHFPAKDDLVVAYLDKVDVIWTGQLTTAAEAAGPAPAEQLVGMFDALASACHREGYRGCAFINAAAESQPGTAVHDRTVAHKTAVRAWVRDLAEAPGPRIPDAGPLADPAPRRRPGQRLARRRPGRTRGGQGLGPCPRRGSPHLMRLPDRF